jgi:TonB family protein
MDQYKEVLLFEFTIPGSAPRSPRWLAASIVGHGLAVFLLFAIRFSTNLSSDPVAAPRFTLIAPARETPVTLPRVHTPRHREFHPLAPAPAQLESPAPAIEIPKPNLPEIPRAAIDIIPVFKPSAIFEVKSVAPAPAPKPVVKASGFESAETAATGPARGALTAVGSFESAHLAEGAAARSKLLRPEGFSEASSGSVASMPRRNVVTSARFGDTTVEKGAAASHPTALASRLTPVEILSKPKPTYTADARAKNIEGEVLLDVQFSASGDLRILRVVRGLGHGLDETAVAAAEGIRFLPAARDGAAVDCSALVHIVFQLAN